MFYKSVYCLRFKTAKQVQVLTKLHLVDLLDVHVYIAYNQLKVVIESDIQAPRATKWW